MGKMSSVEAAVATAVDGRRELSRVVNSQGKGSLTLQSRYDYLSHRSYQVLRGAKSPAPGISGSNFTGDNMLNRDGIDTSSPQPPGSTTLTTSSNLRPAISHFLDTTQGEMSQRRMSHASSLYMDARGTFDLVEPNTSLDNARIGREDDGGLGQVQDHMAGTDVIATGSRTIYPPSFRQSNIRSSSLTNRTH